MSSLAVVFDSKTGNVARFMKKLPENVSVYRATEIDTIDQPFLLVTYTTGHGLTPDSTKAFLRKNHKQMKGVAASGNKNWGLNYAKAADNIANEYNVPIVTKFELSGSASVLETIMDFVNSHSEDLIVMKPNTGVRGTRPTQIIVDEFQYA